MKDLMLKLLTYEPFEEISGDEKDYVDAVLNGRTTFTEQSLLEYHDLFCGFMSNLLYKPQYGIAWEKVKWDNYSWLATWKEKYYPASNYMRSATRKPYPVLFKKICFFWITEGKLADATFMRGIGLRENILNKWQVSPRYRKLINQDTYSSINLYRNGKKQKYLVLPIKAAYYESSRQTAPIRFFNPGEMAEWIAPKVEQLPPFIDVFAGTGTVAASMNTKEKVVNDIDVGAVCFLYAMVHDSKEVIKRLVQLYNNFVSKNIAHAQWYTLDDWQKHQSHYSHYTGNQKFEQVMIRIRNNYQDIQEHYKKATIGVITNFVNPSPKDIIMFYDIGVAWLFLNSIKPKAYIGNVFTVTDMDVDACLAFLKNVIGIDVHTNKDIQPLYAKCHAQDNSDATFLEQYKIHTRQVQFTKGKSYMKTMKDAVIRCEDFRILIKMYDEGFIYLDSPYFLTTDYQIPFRDKEHKQMLDLLRDSKFDWLFSMQYKEGYINKQAKHNSERLKNQKEGQPLIKNYRTYYEGFVHPFKVIYENELPYYVADKSSGKDKGDINKRQLWVMLFANNKNTSCEMMICNFDMRRVFPYDRYEGVFVFPFEEFLKAMFDKNIGHRCYSMLIDEARKWRSEYIINNYASGVRV